MDTTGAAPDGRRPVARSCAAGVLTVLSLHLGTLLLCGVFARGEAAPPSGAAPPPARAVSPAASGATPGVTPGATPGATQGPTPGSSTGALLSLDGLTPEQWSRDIDELVAGLEQRHVDPFGKVPRAEFDAAVVALRARLATMPPHRVLVELARLAAMLGDPHTTAALDQINLRFRTLPIRMGRLDEGVVIVAATDDHAALLGREVVSINDVPIAEVADRIATVAASDNQWGARQRFAALAHFAELLEALEVIPAEGPVVVQVRVPDSATAPQQDGDAPTTVVSMALVPLPPGTPPRFRSLVDPSAHATPPISWRGDRSNYWFEAIPDEDTVYFNYSRCIDNPGKRFALVADEAMQAMSGMAEPRIIVDLRQNGGGDSRVIEPLITALANDPRFAKPGAVVTLIAPRTQSSAAMNAVALKSRANATLIGEPTGQRPNHLGEMRTFNLPNSGAVVSVSTKRFRQVTGDPEAIMPDITVPVRVADVVAGRDVALERAIALPRGE